MLHKDLKQLEQPNLIKGLVNVGNTCFLNSTLQVLFHTHELMDFFESNVDSNGKTNPWREYVQHKDKPVYYWTLMNEWDKLRQSIISGNSKTMNPSPFIRAIQTISQTNKSYKSFKGIQLNNCAMSQNDMAEFFVFLMEQFHNALSRSVTMTIKDNKKDNKDNKKDNKDNKKESKDETAIKCYEMIKTMYEKNYSIIFTLFYGIQISHLTVGDKCNKTPEPFLMLNLPIPNDIKETKDIKDKKTSLNDCLDLYVKKETVCVRDDIGNTVQAQKQILFWSLPPLLVMDIKRFNCLNNKIQQWITFPLIHLDLSGYVVGYNSHSYVYDLYAVCNHYGTTTGGHYTSFVKHKNGNWYHFNDSSVCQIHESQVVTPNAYCFFYRKRK